MHVLKKIVWLSIYHKYILVPYWQQPIRPMANTMAGLIKTYKSIHDILWIPLTLYCLVSYWFDPQDLEFKSLSTRKLWHFISRLGTCYNIIHYCSTVLAFTLLDNLKIVQHKASLWLLLIPRLALWAYEKPLWNYLFEGKLLAFACTKTCSLSTRTATVEYLFEGSCLYNDRVTVGSKHSGLFLVNHNCLWFFLSMTLRFLCILMLVKCDNKQWVSEDTLSTT